MNISPETSPPNWKVAFSATLLERLKEALADIRGEASRTPPWVKNLGLKLAKELIPADAITAARAAPTAFTDGLACASNVSREPWISEVIASLSREHQEQDQKFLSAVPGEVCRYLTAEPVARGAFFQGFTMGLNRAAFFEIVFDRLEEELENPKGLFARHLFMWLKWPEIEALASPEEAFRFCNKAFAGTDQSTIVGDKASFRKFCERIGYYERKKRTG